MRVHAVVMPQKGSSSECEEPSELPSDGESLNAGGISLCVRSAGCWTAGAPLHLAPPLHSSAAERKEALTVSTLSRDLTLRRLLCAGRYGGRRNTVG